MDEEEIIRQAMSLLGRRTSAKKKASSRRNAKKPRRKHKKRRAKPVDEPAIEVTATHPDGTVVTAPIEMLAEPEQTNPTDSTETNIKKEVAPSDPIGKLPFHEEGN